MPRRGAAMRHRKPHPNSLPTSTAASPDAGLLPKDSRLSPQFLRDPRRIRSAHSRRARIVAHVHGEGQRSLILSFTLALTFCEQLVKHTRLARARLQKSPDLLNAQRGHRSQYKPAFFFRPRRAGSLIEAILLAQIGWNHHLALGTDDGSKAAHRLNLTIM